MTCYILCFSMEAGGSSDNQLATPGMFSYTFRVNNRNTRTRCKICSKLTVKTPERRQWRPVAFKSFYR